MIYAFITARGGSKGIPLKNIYPLCGKPLIAYTIEAALQSCVFERVIVSTDNDAIRQISLSLEAEVFERPDELAGDNTSSVDAVGDILHRLDNCSAMPEYFALLQPTSPLRNASHISEAMQSFISSGCKSSISVCEAEHSPYKMMVLSDGALSPVFSTEQLHMPRQSLPVAYRQNGAMYIASSKEFLKHKTFFLQPVLPYIMKREESVDIDGLADIAETERYLINGKS